MSEKNRKSLMEIGAVDFSYFACEDSPHQTRETGNSYKPINMTFSVPLQFMKQFSCQCQTLTS